MNAVPMRADQSIDIECEFPFGMFTLKCDYYLTGRYHAATSDSPREYPSPVVERVQMFFGDYTALLDFSDLPLSVRDHIREEIAQS